ncbi:hypothetical protein L861_02255 [Litchfieldella anticariensis FP35 = DSM 16096]|uniref:Glycosyltransferase subfamily 4-like N-terminal domain-containing protein n=1 Tax=Litchfieldella anticariensis (strain DSM 16096 / CECT 5854 / CIP 108499 / LMG 22089 / FP35) TaxID=1121939 RepID=S2LHM5_LITA3|nr:glycosyltransferase [Halomonas anticariensis]EPC04156.1 hypothetical protein L861_02255 [Halomonas anticariensis FP35 = DSM 16096]
MKKVLYISPFFYPEPISTGKWNSILCQAISKRADCTVDVFCMYPFYPQWKIDLSDQQLPGIKIKRVGKGVRFFRSQAINRMILEIYFSVRVLFEMVRNRKKYDYFVCVLPPSLFAFFVSLFNTKKGKVISIVHDLQSIYASQKTGFVWGVIKKLIDSVESYHFRRADKIISLSSEMKEEVARNGGDLAKSSVCYPFVTLAKNSSGPEVSAAKHDSQWGSLDVVYSGALGEKQNPKALLEIFSQVNKEGQKVNAHVFSCGHYYESLKAEYHEAVRFHDLVPEEQLPDLLAASYLHVVPQAEGTSSGSLPSKLPNLLAAGVPILLITDPDSEVASLLSGVAGVEICQSWDKSLITEKIAEMIDSDFNKSELIASRTETLKNFEIDNLVENILEV